MNHLSASTFLPYYLRHANMASISQSRKVTHTKPAGLVAIFHLLILAFEALPHLTSYLVQLDINLVNLLAQRQWPVFFVQLCEYTLADWQLTCLCDLGLFRSLGVSLSWSGFDLALQSVIVMRIEARERPLRRIYPMNLMITDMSMNHCLNSSVQHLSLSSVSWVNSQGPDTTPIHKLTPQLEWLVTTCGDFQISLDITSQLLFKNTPFDFRSFNPCVLQSDSTRILPCKSLEAPG